MILALECYTGNVYQGYRNQSKSLHRCVDGRCKFGKDAKWQPGCYINNQHEWDECSVPPCGLDVY